MHWGNHFNIPSMVPIFLDLLQNILYQPESRLDNGVFSNDLSHTGIGHVLENIDQVLKIHSFLSL
jgi:hypothetical protein